MTEDQFGIISTPELFDHMLEPLPEIGYGINTAFLPPALVTGLAQKLEQAFQNGEMKEAGVGQQAGHQINKRIRSDHILWLQEDSEDLYEKAFFDRMNAFVQHLNRYYYTGIRSFEFHYARYDVGSFYKKHIDQFRTDSGRKFSMITYLNDDWRDHDGGELVLYQQEEKKVIPQGGSTVIFKADELPHEVLPAKRVRRSITGWLKNK